MLKTKLFTSVLVMMATVCSGAFGAPSVRQLGTSATSTSAAKSAGVKTSRAATPTVQKIVSSAPKATTTKTTKTDTSDSARITTDNRLVGVPLGLGSNGKTGGMSGQASSLLFSLNSDVQGLKEDYSSLATRDYADRIGQAAAVAIEQATEDMATNESVSNAIDVATADLQNAAQVQEKIDTATAGMIKSTNLDAALQGSSKISSIEAEIDSKVGSGYVDTAVSNATQKMVTFGETGNIGNLIANDTTIGSLRNDINSKVSSNYVDNAISTASTNLQTAIDSKVGSSYVDSAVSSAVQNATQKMVTWGEDGNFNNLLANSSKFDDYYTKTQTDQSFVKDSAFEGKFDTLVANKNVATKSDVSDSVQNLSFRVSGDKFQSSMDNVSWKDVAPLSSFPGSDGCTRSIVADNDAHTITISGCDQPTQVVDIPTGGEETCTGDEIKSVRISDDGKKIYTQKCNETSETEHQLATGATCATDDIVSVRVADGKLYKKKCGETTEIAEDLPSAQTCAADDIVSVRVADGKLYKKKCGETTEIAEDLPSAQTCTGDEIKSVRISDDGKKIYTKKCNETSETEHTLATANTCEGDEIKSVRISDDGKKIYTKKCNETSETEHTLATANTCEGDEIKSVRISDDGKKIYTKKCNETSETEHQLATGATCATDDIVSVRVADGKLYKKKCGETTEIAEDLPSACTGLNLAKNADGDKVVLTKCDGTSTSEVEVVTEGTIDTKINNNNTTLAGTYQTKITAQNPLSSSLVSGLKTKLSEFTNDSNFITNSALSGYATTSDVNAKQDKITTTNPLSSSLVSGLKTKLSEFTNDSNFITNSALSGYATTSDLNAKQDTITSSNIGTVIVDNLSSDQKAALNSGVTSSTVSTVATNASSIGSLETVVGKSDSTGLRGTVATLGADLEELTNDVKGSGSCSGGGRGGTSLGSVGDDGNGHQCTLSLEQRIAAIEAWINAQ